MTSSMAPMDADVDRGDTPTPDDALAADNVAAQLTSLVEKLGGTRRESQEQMAIEVAAAIRDGHHLMCEAPTGTGKSFAYGVPAALASDPGGPPIIIATVKKSLQEQLMNSDLPALARHFPGLNYANLKGRGNYVCKSRLEDAAGGDALFDERVDPDDFESMLDWASETETGDHADAPNGVPERLLRQVSVSGNECPGADNCRFGDVCFAEKAKARAFSADIVVTNLAMLLVDMSSEAAGKVVPEHDTVIIDEAHTLHEAATNALGVELRSGRFSWAAAVASEFIAQEQRDELESLGKRIGMVLDELATTEAAVVPAEGELGSLLSTASSHVLQCRGKVMSTPVTTDEREKRELASASLAGLAGDIGLLLEPPEGSVCWAEPSRGKAMASLRMAYVDLAPLLRQMLFDTRTVVMTSATMTVGGAFDRVQADMGLTLSPPSPARELMVPSPFDYQQQGRLFVPKAWPTPRSPQWPEMFREQTWRFIEAAGGRTMALFTSWGNLRATVEYLRPKCEEVGITLLVQGEAPAGRLIQQMREDETAVLCGVASFWEGVDVAGDSLLSVIIDKVPFPRPGEPLMDARRNAAELRKENPFSTVDIPKAATLLAQGVGRLIRRVDDVGVVAVMDSRLATKGYRNLLLGSLPNFKRTIDAEAVEAFLRERVSGK